VPTEPRTHAGVCIEVFTLSPIALFTGVSRSCQLAGSRAYRRSIGHSSKESQTECELQTILIRRYSLVLSAPTAVFQTAAGCECSRRSIILRVALVDTTIHKAQKPRFRQSGCHSWPLKFMHEPDSCGLFAPFCPSRFR